MTIEIICPLYKAEKYIEKLHKSLIMQEKVNDDGTIEGVEYIGYAAFRECTNLKTVQMANSVTSMANEVFYQDVNLESINLSKGINKIDNYKYSIKSININNDILQIYYIHSIFYF